MKFQLTKMEERPDAAISLEEAAKVRPKDSLVVVGRKMVGNYDTIPEVKTEQCFFFQGNLGFSDCLRTSVVKEIVESSDDRILFKTMNSIYELKKIDELHAV